MCSGVSLLSRAILFIKEPGLIRAPQRPTIALRIYKNLYIVVLLSAYMR